MAAALAATTAAAADVLDVAAILARVNELRAVHTSPPVMWSPSLATFAGQAAQRIAMSQGGNVALTHTRDNPYGENLALIMSGRVDACPVCTAVGMWYSESSAFDGYYGVATPVTRNATGHFTQLVWAATTHVGAAVATVPSADTSSNTAPSSLTRIVVMEFTPPGNVLGTFSANVFRPYQEEESPTVLLLLSPLPPSPSLLLLAPPPSPPTVLQQPLLQQPQPPPPSTLLMMPPPPPSPLPHCLPPPRVHVVTRITVKIRKPKSSTRV